MNEQQSALILAIAANNADQVMALCYQNRFQNIDFGNFLALRLAARLQYQGIGKLLIFYGAKINAAIRYLSTLDKPTEADQSVLLTLQGFKATYTGPITTAEVSTVESNLMLIQACNAQQESTLKQLCKQFVFDKPTLNRGLLLALNGSDGFSAFSCADVLVTYGAQIKQALRMLLDGQFLGGESPTIPSAIHSGHLINYVEATTEEGFEPFIDEFIATGQYLLYKQVTRPLFIKDGEARASTATTGSLSPQDSIARSPQR